MIRDGSKNAERGNGNPEPLMNIDELSTYLNVPKSWVYEQSRLDKIPRFKAGKYLRFDRRAVLEWMTSQV